MTHESTSAPNTAEYDLIRLLDAGTERITGSFSVAYVDQGEVLFEERRLLLTPRDDLYEQYKNVLQATGLPCVDAEPHLSVGGAVIGEIPREARTMPQIIRSVQPERRQWIPDYPAPVRNQYLR